MSNDATFQKFYNEAQALATTRERIATDFKAMPQDSQSIVLTRAGYQWSQREQFLTDLAWAAVRKPVLA